MSRPPNDQRSNSKNQNNPAYTHSQNNRLNQLNPNNPAYQGPRKAGETDRRSKR